MTLETYMRKAGLDTVSVAAAVGVGPEAVRKWLRGERIPRPAQMARIVAFTGGKVGPADFYAAAEAVS